MPSRTFIIRGSIAIGIVGILFLSRTAWFRGLFTKNAAAPSALDPNATIGELLEKDTNGNGISDWEEKLWGLDPTVLYTNGVSNAQIIEEKKQSLDGSGSAAMEPTDQIDKLARDLYTLSQALGESGTDSETTQSVAGAVGTTIPIKYFDNTYDFADLKTTKTTTASLLSYRENLAKILTPYEKETPGMEVVIQALESGDFSSLPSLGGTVTIYAAAAKGMKGVTVPIGIAQYHLDAMNGLAGMSKSFVYLQHLDTDGLNSLSGIALYKTYNALFLTAVVDLNQYLQRYGILQ